MATTSLGLCGTQRNTRTTGHITQFSHIQSWFQSSHTKNKYTQWCPCVSKCLCDKEKLIFRFLAHLTVECGFTDMNMYKYLVYCSNEFWVNCFVAVFTRILRSPSEFHNFIGRSMYFFYWKILQITADSSSHVRYSWLHKKEQKVEHINTRFSCLNSSEKRSLLLHQRNQWDLGVLDKWEQAAYSCVKNCWRS